MHQVILFRYINHFKRYPIWALVLLLAGCASLFGPKTLKSPHDPEAVHRQLAAGSNTLIGRSMVMEARKQDYKPVTCHGSEVYLMPMTARSKEWAEMVYGKGAGDGVEPNGRTFLAEGGYRMEVQGVATLFRETIRARCNIFGEFRFNKVADGDYYLFTDLAFTVRGDVYPDQSPKSVMAKVHLEGGKVVVVDLWKDAGEDDAPLFLLYPFASSDPDATFDVINHHFAITRTSTVRIFGDDGDDFLNLFSRGQNLNPFFGDVRIVALVGLGGLFPESLAIHNAHAWKMGHFQQHLCETG